ncbi:hypothetical protein SCHPADRAFT_839583 [Schizopora paradoxa]|uniref:Uncharacterized protein n=1 Tax=Schizopora paradoxa TaxID=27342 RepID=A0A0H2R1T2_9AGAM|nr:hypothetical protein SCHPADRAFT_839583 [Schizopora paradoxa]
MISESSQTTSSPVSEQHNSPTGEALNVTVDAGISGPAASLLPPPPSYSSSASTSIIDNFGFPLGYFVIRSLATGRVLDVASDSQKDGGEVILWPAKESSLVEGFRKPEAENQVFYIDQSGALCCRNSGHAIDVEDGRLVQRHRRPITYPYPNAFSHPLPQFRFDHTTGRISVDFECDPTYTPSQGDAWKKKTYLLASIPKRKPKSLLSSVLSNPLSAFGLPSPGPKSPTNATIEDMRDSGLDLREDELVERDWEETEEVDDSPDWHRYVRVIGVSRPSGFEGDDDGEADLSLAARERRTWEVLPLRNARASTSKTSRPT